MAKTVDALDIRSVSYAYGRGETVLDDVSLTAPKGRFTALLGPNGAGKTTLFALIARLFDGTGGTIAIAGKDIASQPGLALASLGIVFQQPTLDLDLSVAQNLHYFAALHGMPKRRAEERIETELTRLDMHERRNEKVRRLNGGHRRRVEMARALLHEPEFLLLDEPTVGLDIPTRHMIVQHVHALCRDDGIGVLWATHLIDEVEDGDNVVILHRGKVAARGSTEEIRHSTGVATMPEAFNLLTGGEDSPS